MKGNKTMSNPTPVNNFPPDAGVNRRWKPGEYGGYNIWLKNLTPEERAAHLQQRAVKRTMRKAMQQAQEEMQEAWINALDQAAAKVLERAINDGDPQALQVVWDRVIGKPSTEIEMSVENRQATLAEIMQRVKASTGEEQLKIGNNDGKKE
jgi:hypothetical protein